MHCMCCVSCLVEQGMSKNATSPPTSPRRGKMMNCQVYLLDDTTQTFQVPVSTDSVYLLDDTTQAF